MKEKDGQIHNGRLLLGDLSVGGAGVGLYTSGMRLDMVEKTKDKEPKTILRYVTTNGSLDDSSRPTQRTGPTGTEREWHITQGGHWKDGAHLCGLRYESRKDVLTEKEDCLWVDSYRRAEYIQVGRFQDKSSVHATRHTQDS